MSEDRPANSRLDSWKEIAAYLKRDVRTVIRWEDNGLPVHRVPGGKRQAVFALAQEVDAWLLQQDLQPPVNSARQAGSTENDGKDSVNSATQSVGADNFLRAFRAKKQALFSGGASLLIFATIIIVTFTHLRRPAILQPMRLVQLTDDAYNKVNLRTDGKFLYFNEFEGSREILASTPLSGGAVRKVPTPFPNVDLQDVSNDGQYLLVSSFVGTETDRPIWYVSTQGGSPGRVGDLMCRFARWSPDNHRVACATGTTITVADSDGLHKRTLASFESSPGFMVWSPDGTRLRFVLQDTSGAISPWEISVPTDNGPAPSAAVKLNLGRNCCLDWAWGHGRDFLYMSLASKGRTALFLRRKRSMPTGWPEPEFAIPVNIGTPASLAPAISGNTLFVLINGSWRGQLLKFNSEQVFETILPGLSAIYLSFSPDGQWMSYVNTVDQSLWRSRVDGSEALQLSQGFEYVQLSSWSPGGRRIAFMGKMAGRPWRIFLVDRDGGAAEEAAPGEDNQGTPTWSADGKKLVYGNVNCDETQSCWIRTLDLSTGRIEALPGSQGFRTARWSPDGKYIAAFIPEKHQLMLFDVNSRTWHMLAESVTGDNLNWSHDSQFVYADSPQGERPVIERFRVSDGHRATVVSLSELQKVPGQMDFWFGLTRDNSPILVHRLSASEVYALDWKEP